MKPNLTLGRLAGVVVALSAACSVGTAVAQPAPVARGGDLIVQGHTQPSLRKQLAFSFQGIIGKVAVKDGDVIHAGQELMRQDDRIELSRLQGLKLDADRTLLVKAKQATLDNKRLVLKRKEESYKKNAITITEYQEAQLDVTLAEAEVDLAHHDAEVKQADVSLQTTHVELLTLNSPMDGIVEQVIQTEGEVANIDKPSIVIVKNDPLYIEIKSLSTSVVSHLKKGDTLAVRYPGEEDWKPATINLISPVANSAAETQTIRLEMANPEGRWTGLSIDVKVPQTAVAEAKE